MLGEIQGSKRPQNSLLEEVLDYEFGSKLSPVFDEEKNKTLEDFIKYRIKEGVFDDVIRIAEKDEKDFRPTSIELDHEKSKKGLGELLEDQYMKEVEGVKEKDKLEEIHDEVSKLFRAICYKLDSLSNTNYTPRKEKDEDKIEVIKPNVPAIEIEEVTPITVSDTNRLAPEEIFEKQQNKKSDTEKTTDDRRKDRRLNKQILKKALEKKEKAIKKKDRENPNKPMNVDRAMKVIKELGSNNTTFMNETDTTNYTQSSHVFSKIQEDKKKEKFKSKKQDQDQNNTQTKTNQSINQYKF